jgi:predicted amidohydrolase
MTDAKNLRGAAVQMTSGTSVETNLRTAGELIARAAADGADLVVLPENFSFLGAVDADRIAAAEQDGRGPAQDFLAEQAARHGIWLVGGTIPILREGGRASSRSMLFGPDGRLAAAYDKIHLFDVVVPDNESETYQESATTIPGSSVVTAAAPFGTVGMCVCYDIRFPALFHRLGALGIGILVVPAAFTVPTGQAHWRALLTARAVESLVYVIASAQWGEHAGGRRTYGHSMIVGPWGQVLDECETGSGIAIADLDMMRLAEIRRKFPTLDHRREL